MFQESELVNLLFTLIVFCVFLPTFTRENFRRFRLFGLGLCCLLLAQILTIIESFVFPDLFNTLEHAGLMGTSIFFAMACRKLFLDMREEQSS